MSVGAAILERLRELGRDTESGAATVEFVLIFPLQLMLTLMIIQFSFIAHAHIVVAQAAFMGARAAAVADGFSPTNDPGAPAANIREAAALRVVARTVGVLTSGEAPDGGYPTPSVLGGGGGQSPLGQGAGELRWTRDGGQGGYDAARQQEAYRHLDAKVGGGSSALITIIDGTTSPQQGYIACEVRYDYVMTIPLANRVFAGVGGLLFGGHTFNQNASRAHNRAVFTVRRMGYCPTPWTQREGGSSGSPGMPTTTPNGPP